MTDFTQDDLFDALDRAVRDAFDRGGIAEPPLDLLELATGDFGLRVEYAEPEEPARYGDRPKRRPGPNTIVLRDDMGEESRQTLAAKAIAKRLLPDIFTRLGIIVGTENRSAQTQLMGLLTTRLLLPTRWFASDARRMGFDLLELKTRYPGATFEMIAWRMLDIAEDPVVIAMVDDGNVAARRSNRTQAGRALTEAEQLCVERVTEEDEPACIRRDGWTAWGWPTKGVPYRRIIIRAVPDEV